MAENLMNSGHKATNQQYRDNYDVTFADCAEKKEGAAGKVKKEYDWQKIEADMYHQAGEILRSLLERMKKPIPAATSDTIKFRRLRPFEFTPNTNQEGEG